MPCLSSVYTTLSLLSKPDSFQKVHLIKNYKHVHVCSSVSDFWKNLCLLNNVQIRSTKMHRHPEKSSTQEIIYAARMHDYIL